MRDKFIKTVSDHFRDFCDHYKLEQTPENMAKYLVEINLIKDTHAVKFCIQQDHHLNIIENYERKGVISESVKELCVEYDRSMSQIWSYVTTDAFEFRPRKVFFQD